MKKWPIYAHLTHLLNTSTFAPPRPLRESVYLQPLFHGDDSISDGHAMDGQNGKEEMWFFLLVLAV